MISLKLMKLIILVALILITAEASSLVRRSLLRPRLEDECFTSRPSDRPLMYPLFKYFGKMKDAVVRMVNVLVAHAKDSKLIN